MFEGNNKPSDNFAYKNEEEKSELQDQMYSAKISLEVKWLALMLLLGIVAAGISFVYQYLNS